MIYKIKYWLFMICFSLSSCIPLSQQESQVSNYKQTERLLDEAYKKLMIAIKEIVVEEGLIENKGKEYYICGKKSPDKELSENNVFLTFDKDLGGVSILAHIDNRLYGIGLGENLDEIEKKLVAWSWHKSPTMHSVVLKMHSGCDGNIHDQKISPYLLEYWKHLTKDDRGRSSQQPRPAPPNAPTLCKPTNAFKIMGLDPETELDLATLNQRRKVLMLNNHPDKVGHSEEANRKTQGIAEAYATLKAWLAAQAKN